MQVEYIVKLESLACVRRVARQARLEISQAARGNWLQAWRDRMRGMDYEAQEKLVKELHETLLDPDRGSQVGHHTIYSRYNEPSSTVSSC